MNRKRKVESTRRVATKSSNQLATEPISEWTRVNYISVISAVAAVLSASFAFWQGTISRTALVSNQRAWLAPVAVTIKSDLETGKPFTTSIQYKNVGKEPALNLGASGQVQFVPNNNETINNLGKQSLGMCDTNLNNTSRNQTIYPSEANGYELIATSTFDQPTAAVLKGESVLYLQGCLVYDSMGEARKSAFCFYWIYDPAKALKDWDWRFCQYGNVGI